MAKHQINYSRIAPDHRVPFDYTFVKKTQNPMQYLRYYKQGILSSWLKHYHIHLSGLWTVLAAGIAVWVFWDKDEDAIYRDKINKMPALHFSRQFLKGNVSPYDNVLRKFASDPFGNKDQVFEEY